MIRSGREAIAPFLRRQLHGWLAEVEASRRMSRSQLRKLKLIAPYQRGKKDPR